MSKKVLLFSGGFDSRLEEFLIKPDILLYVDMDTSYSAMELAYLKTLPQSYQDRLIIKKLPLGEYERENKYLPYRNLILGAIAMEYGQHVYFGFNMFDDAPDKDEMFLKRLNSLFKHLNVNCLADMGWESEEYGFYAPFKHLTKTELVARCIKEGMPVEDIQMIRTCYSGEHKLGCGHCGPCFHKAVALLNNHIYTPDAFDVPYTVEHLTKEVKKRLNNAEEFTTTYIREIKEALRNLRQIQK